MSDEANQVLQYRFTLTREEFLRTADAIPLWQPFFLIPLGGAMIPITLFATIAFFGKVPGQREAGAGTFVAMLIACAVIMSCVGFVLRQMRRKFLNGAPTPAECVVTLDGDGVRWRFGEIETLIGWRQVRRVRVGKEFAIFVLRDVSDLSLPLRVVPDREGLLQRLRERGCRVKLLGDAAGESHG